MTERVTIDQVPVCPKPQMDGVVDIGLHRWRFSGGNLVNFIEYRTEAECAADLFPWAKLYTPTDQHETFAARQKHGCPPPSTATR